MNKISQKELIKEFYLKNPRREIKHAAIVPWLMEEFKKRTGKPFRDPDRGIRKLAQSGFLIKVKKGVYKYVPESVSNRNLEDFTSKQKLEIKKRDGFKCVICGKGEKNGIELHIDHIKPKDLGGSATIENGQTLCAQHNFLKKNLNQTETGKKMFIKLYKLVKKENNKELIEFTENILEVYKKHKINGHIDWKK